jgi:hypothetical protein
MKEVVEYLCDSFVDFEGKTHNFVLCAVSKVDPNVELYFNDNETWAESTRTLTLGCSVCNTVDEYNEELGKKIAYSRAVSNKVMPTLVSTLPGVINTAVVSALLRQEADYIKRDPNCVITGYNEKMKKVQEKKDAELRYKQMTAEEQLLVECAKKGYNLDYYAKLAQTLNN